MRSISQGSGTYRTLISTNSKSVFVSRSCAAPAAAPAAMVACEEGVPPTAAPLAAWLPAPLKSYADAIESWLVQHHSTSSTSGDGDRGGAALNRLRNMQPNALSAMIDDVFPSNISPASLGMVQLHEAVGQPLDAARMGKRAGAARAAVADDSDAASAHGLGTEGLVERDPWDADEWATFS